MKLYQATKNGVCAGIVVADRGRVVRAAPILGKQREGTLWWWMAKQLTRKGYKLELIRHYEQ